MNKTWSSFVGNVRFLTPIASVLLALIALTAAGTYFVRAIPQADPTREVIASVSVVTPPPPPGEKTYTFTKSVTIPAQTVTPSPIFLTWTNEGWAATAEPTTIPAQTVNVTVTVVCNAEVCIEQ